MDIFTGDVPRNLATAEKLFAQAAPLSPDYVVLPEMWATGFSYDNLKSLAEDEYQPIREFLRAKARELNTVVIGGTVAEPENNRLYNTTLVFSPSGDEIGKFRKHNPFTLNEEHLYFAPGKDLLVFEHNGVRCGVLICYDLRFSELFLHLNKLDAQIVFVPAQFPHPRQDHWVTLLKARAIENQYFVVGCNRVGGRKIEHFGHSSIINPHGVILAQAGTGEEVLSGTIDLDEIHHVRQSMPMRT